LQPVKNTGALRKIKIIHLVFLKPFHKYDGILCVKQVFYVVKNNAGIFNKKEVDFFTSVIFDDNGKKTK